MLLDCRDLSRGKTRALHARVGRRDRQLLSEMSHVHSPVLAALRTMRHGSLLTTVVLTSACVDTSEPLASPTPSRASLLTASSQAIRPEEQLFVDFEKEAPGTAGFCFDADGRLVVKLVNASKRDVAASALARLAGRGRLHGRERGRSMGAPRFETAQFSFEQLRVWRDIAFDSVFVQMRGIQALDLDEAANRVSFAIEPWGYLTTRLAIISRLAALGVDPAALAFRPASKFRRNAFLAPPGTTSDAADTVVGGLQIFLQHHDGQFSACTLGFVAERNGRRGIVTASHCGTNYFNPDGDPLFQGFSRQVATETVDPDAYTCGIFRCRGADAAFYATTGSAPMAIGKILRLDGLNNGSLTVDQTTPYWTVVEEENDNLVGGQRVDKVGRTTGWTSGFISRTCEDFTTWNEVTRCTYEANYGNGAGDSGAPVFVILNYQDEVILAGINEGIADGQSRFSKLWRIKSDLGGRWTNGQPGALRRCLVGEFDGILFRRLARRLEGRTIRKAVFSVMAAGLMATGGTSCAVGCPGDLRSSVHPARQTVRVGQAVVATASARGCRDRRELPDTWRYFVNDTAIVALDSVTGNGFGRAAGKAFIFARGHRYGRTANVAQVIVTQTP